MFSGHHDGMRGIAGGNCAYIAQSYGASIHENEIAEMQSSSSGCSAALANAQVHADGDERDAADVGEVTGRLHQRRHLVLMVAASSARRASGS